MTTVVAAATKEGFRGFGCRGCGGSRRATLLPVIVISDL